MYQHKLTISNNVAPLYMMYNINTNVHCTTFFEPNANLHLFDSKNYSKNGKYNLPWLTGMQKNQSILYTWYPTKQGRVACHKSSWEIK